jgi:hypothetical protein
MDSLSQNNLSVVEDYTLGGRYELVAEGGIREAPFWEVPGYQVGNDIDTGCGLNQLWRQSW